MTRHTDTVEVITTDQRLMKLPVVFEADPTTRLLHGLEPVTVRVSIVEGSDDLLGRAGLFKAVELYKLLA